MSRKTPAEVAEILRESEFQFDARQAVGNNQNKVVIRNMRPDAMRRNLHYVLAKAKIKYTEAHHGHYLVLTIL